MPSPFSLVSILCGTTLMKIYELLGESYKIIKSDPTGVELISPEGVKMTVPPEKVAAMQADPNNPNKYKLSQSTISPAPGKPTTPTVGATVDIDQDQNQNMMGGQQPTIEDQDDDEDLISSGRNRDVGGDATDDFIDDVIDKDFEKAQRNELSSITHLAGLQKHK